MKTKLTLTVRKDILEKARRFSRKTGKSISRLFEEYMENPELSNGPKSDSQKAALQLLQMLESKKSIPSYEDDKSLIRDHVTRKYS